MVRDWSESSENVKGWEQQNGKRKYRWRIKQNRGNIDGEDSDNW
jgi:hypothetical protein